MDDLIERLYERAVIECNFMPDNESRGLSRLLKEASDALKLQSTEGAAKQSTLDELAAEFSRLDVRFGELDSALQYIYSHRDNPALPGIVTQLYDDFVSGTQK